MKRLWSWWKKQWSALPVHIWSAAGVAGALFMAGLINGSSNGWGLETWLILLAGLTLAAIAAAVESNCTAALAERTGLTGSEVGSRAESP